MDFEHSARVELLRAQVSNFIDRYVLPYNGQWYRDNAAGHYPIELLDDMKALARDEGLWNLFLPGLRDDEPGMRLNNLEYAPLAEIMGKLPWCSEVFNCSAPDTGNMELLHLFASPEQRERWLWPLMEGQIRSCFAMTEPDVASSDATNIQTSIRRVGDELVINGRKWFISGVAHPRCRLAIVMGCSDECAQAPERQRQSMALVPMDTPGLSVLRNIPVMQHLAPEGHCELLFRDVRVPVANMLGEAGAGFAMAQARLGPGRIHHCMRTIGQCELALELMCARAMERKAFGRYLSDQANVRDWIAEARMEIDQARLYVLRAAALLDREGNRAGRVEVAAIKVVAARLQTRLVDRAMQVFGAMGLSPDTPLAFLWTWGRAMRLLDGPDEVHLGVVAKRELARTRERLGELTPYFNLPADH